MLGGSYYEWRDNQTPFETFTSETGVQSVRSDGAESCAAALCIGGRQFPPGDGSSFRGRNFTAEEDRPNGPKVALISYSLWRSHFGGDAGILNKLVSLDGVKRA